MAHVYHWFLSILFSSASNRIIEGRDHASIQINVAEVDPVRGVMTGKYQTYAICGSIRQMGESDDSINNLAKRDALLPALVEFNLFIKLKIFS